MEEKTNPVPKPELGPEFKARVRALRRAREDTYQEAYQQTGESPWAYMSGLYPDTDLDYAELDSERLSRTETTITRQVQKLLRIPEITSKRPVVFLEVGGGWGLSALRMAKSMEDSVKQNKVAFIITNFEFLVTPDYVELMQDSLSRRYSKERQEKIREKYRVIKSFMKDNMHLVSYLQSDAGHLGSAKLPGTDIPVKGNVDILLSNLAVSSYSMIPDIDFWVLGKLLSKWGNLILDPRGPNPQDQFFESDRQWFTTVDAHKIGLQNLRKLVPQRKSVLPGFRVFRQQHAPKLDYGPKEGPEYKKYRDEWRKAAK